MTHILSEIKIKNFKSIKDVTFELSAFTPLVGYNNAGKSNILEAIKWLLRKSTLSDNQFNDVNEPIEIEGEISGISEAILDLLADNHKTIISTYLFDDKLYIKRVQLVPNASAAQMKLYIKDPANIGNANEWKANPTGIDQAIQALFPEPIHIGAMENAEEDVSKSKTTSTIGKLLAEIIGPLEATYNDQVQTALDEIRKLLDADSSERATELTEFDTTVNEKVNSFFPGINIKIHVPTPELKEVFSKGTIKVFENLGTDGKDVSSLGHGAQRSIQMALIRHLADIKKAAGEQSSNTLLLIDEPELYLHPQAVEVLKDALKILSSEGFQVVFTTHSPFMITSKDVGNTLLIRKNDILGTHKKNTLKSAIPSVIAEAPSQLELLFSLSNSSNILFSERVILAEGTTENRLLPNLIEKVTSKSIGLHKAALVSMGGSTNTRKAMLVLDTMGIPTKAILDLDYILLNGEKDGFLTTGDADVAFVKSHLASIAPTHGIALNNGWPTKQGSTMTAAAAFNLLASEVIISTNLENLKTKLAPNNIWFWKKGTIESHLNNIPKNERSWAILNTRLETEELDAILPNDHQEIKDFVNWIIV